MFQLKLHILVKIFRLMNSFSQNIVVTSCFDHLAKTIAFFCDLLSLGCEGHGSHVFPLRLSACITKEDKRISVPINVSKPMPV